MPRKVTDSSVDAAKSANDGWLRNHEAVSLLGETRLTKLLHYLYSGERGYHFRAIQEMEKGKSLNEIFAPNSGYSLSVQEMQQENRYDIWLGDYEPGFSRGHRSFNYRVTFDSAGNVLSVGDGGVMIG